MLGSDFRKMEEEATYQNKNWQHVKFFEDVCSYQYNLQIIQALLRLHGS